MLTLKLYPAEYLGLLSYLRFHTAGQDQVPLLDRPLVIQVLLECRHYVEARYSAWLGKRSNRAHSFRLKASHVLALHKDMQEQHLSHYQQSFLTKLDQCLVGFSTPLLS